MKKPLLTRIIIICILAISAIVITSVLASINRRTVKESNDLISHTQDLQLISEQTISALKDVETGSRAYYLTSNDIFLKPFPLLKDSVLKSINKLKFLTADNLPQQYRIDSLEQLAILRLGISKTLITYNQKNISDTTVRIVEKGKLIMDSIRSVVARIQQNENELLYNRKFTAARNEKNTDTLFYILFASLFISFALVFFSIWYNIYLKKNGKWFYIAARTNIFDSRVDKILNGISDPFFVLDDQGLFTFINKAAKSKLGFNKSGLNGKNIFNEFAIYKDNKIGTGIKEVLNRRQVQSFETFDDFLFQWQDVALYPIEDGVAVYIKYKVLGESK